MDEWIKRYQSTYSHLSAPARVREAVAQMRPSVRPGRYVRRLSGVLLAALVLLALLGCGAAAVVLFANEIRK